VVFAIVQTKNESAAEVTSLVGDQFDRMIDTPVPAPELDARKATLIGTFSRSVETTEGLALQIGGLVARGRSPAELSTRIERLSGVDAEAVQRFARDNYATASRRVVVAGNASQFEAAIEAAVPGATSIKQADVDLDR
jgi:zinc protease